MELSLKTKSKKDLLLQRLKIFQLQTFTRTQIKFQLIFVQWQKMAQVNLLLKNNRNYLFNTIKTIGPFILRKYWRMKNFMTWWLKVLRKSLKLKEMLYLLTTMLKGSGKENPWKNLLLVGDLKIIKTNLKSINNRSSIKNNSMRRSQKELVRQNKVLKVKTIKTNAILKIKLAKNLKSWNLLRKEGLKD